ncbi:MAG: sporulation protein YabP [Clostridiaceae bacterium]|jgi:sporulation protein YabP|nr:sporulation protein YabP [Clostridiaceae bacterium]
MAEEKKNPERDLQNIFLRDRKKLLITGVHNVDSFNEECIVVDTDLGLIVVRGIDMHINKLDVEGATLDAEGEIAVIEYLDQTIPQRKGGFLSGLFR